MPESSSAVTGIPLQRVLVTGSAGHIGRVVCPVLRSRGHFVRGFDVRDSESTIR
jgi:nucleoside-diphosphate-sugar epimerase